MKKFFSSLLAALAVTFYLGVVTPKPSFAYFVDENGYAWSDPSDYQYESFTSDPYYSQPSYDQYQYYSEPVYQEIPQIERVNASDSGIGYYINQVNDISGTYGNRIEDLYQTMIWMGNGQENSYYDPGVASGVLTVANYAREQTGESFSPLTGQQLVEVIGATYTMSDYYTANDVALSDQEYLNMLRDYTDIALSNRQY